MFITIHFTTTDGKEVTASDRMVSAWTSTELMQPGSRISLQYDPENPQKIMVVSAENMLLQTNEVEGSFQVVTVSSPHPESIVNSSIRIIGVLSAHGIAKREVVYEGNCLISKWPHAGMTLSIMVNKADPSCFEILWG